MESHLETFDKIYNYIYSSLCSKTEGIIAEYLSEILEDIYCDYVNDYYQKNKKIKK